MSDVYEAEILRLRNLLNEPNRVSFEYVVITNDELRTRNTELVKTVEELKARISELEPLQVVVEAQNAVRIADANCIRELESRNAKLEQRLQILTEESVKAKAADAKHIGELRETNAELKDTNGVLQAQNVKRMVVNAKLESANDELRTTNKDLERRLETRERMSSNANAQAVQLLAVFKNLVDRTKESVDALDKNPDH
jgi:chromosome segregation ATPase